MGLDALISVPFTGKAEKLAGKYRDKLLIVIAGGRGVWDDFQEFTRGNWHSDWDVMAVNDVGMYYDRELEHWYSNHWKQLIPWQQVREFHFPPAKHLHSNMDGHMAIAAWPLPGLGTSGLCATFAGLCLGYGKIVLCGMPLDNTGHFFDPPWKKSNFVNEAREAQWIPARDKVFDGRVCSMSGRSREWLGAP